MKTKKAVLFDIDGTILDSSDFVFTAVQYILDKSNLAITEEKLTKAKGKPLVEFYKYIFPDKDYKLLAKIHNDYQQTRAYFKTVIASPEGAWRSL